MRAEKHNITQEYLARLNSSPFFIVVDYQGLKVGPITELRKRLNKAGAEMHVVKNSIFRIAAKEAGISELGGTLTGQLAVVTGQRDVSSAAKVVKTFVHPRQLSSPFEGNLELLPDGGAFVGWGGIRKLTEFSRDGWVRFELTLPYGDSYRGYRLPWTGKPTDAPLVAVVGDRVYASWNGARGIARWQVLVGPDSDHLAVVASRPWRSIR